MQKNKRVLVTGSSRGIGREVALTLAKDGYDIVLHCNKNTAAAELVKQEILKNCRACDILRFDISNRVQTKEVLDKYICENGSFYGVVLNAGINKDNVFPVMEDDEWDNVIQTNLNGFYNVLKPVVMPMIQARVKGRIIAMTSVSGITGNRGQTNYAASKAGIIGAAKSLALELAKRGITVNCIAPGVIETDMTSDLPKEEVVKMIPMKRFGKPKEVASLAAYLMSENASYITAQVISVNGGLC